jgi:hypothetical protein
MTDTEPLRVTSPTDLLALVPGFFGFHPEDSLVMVTSGALPQPVHCRVDLPTDPIGIEEVAAYLAEVADQHRVSAVAAIVYTHDAPLAEAVAGELAARMRGIGGELLCAVRADGRHWWVLGPRGGSLGTPYDVSTHPFTAQAVADGTVVLGSRRELAASLDGEPGERAEVATCAEEAADRLVRLVDPPLGRPAARHHLVIEGRWVRHRVRRHLEDRQRLDAADVARLLVLMHLSVEVRDVAWAEMHRANARQHVELWRDVVRRAPLELAAAPAGLLGFAAWLSGHGALAWCAVDRAQEAEPDYGLAALLTHALSAAVPPSVWQPIPADALTLFAG